MIRQALAELDLQIMASQLSIMKFLAKRFGPLSIPTDCKSRRDSPALLKVDVNSVLRARVGKWIEFLKENEGRFPKMVQQLAARKLIEQIEETLK